MKSNLDPKTCAEYDINFGGINVKKVSRTYCDLCGEVLSVKIEHCDGRIEKQDLSEYHTSCSE